MKRKVQKRDKASVSSFSRPFFNISRGAQKIQRASFLAPQEAPENPLDRFAKGEAPGKTFTVINSQKVDGADMFVTSTNILGEIVPKKISFSAGAAKGQRSCRFDQTFSIDTGTEIIITTPPGRQGWKGRVSPASLGNPPQCAGKTNIPATLRGAPTDKDYQDLVKNSELEHVQSIKELHQRHFIPFEKFLLGLSATAGTDAGCERQLKAKLGKRPEQATLGFILGDVAETKRFDDPSSTHHGKLTPTYGRNCNSVTLTSKQQHPQQAGRKPGNVAIIAPKVQAIDVAKLSVSGTDLLSDKTKIQTFSSAANASSVMGMLAVHGVTEIHRISPFTMALDKGNPPAGAIAGISELAIDPALVQVSPGMPNMNDWVISQVKGEQFFEILNFGANRDEAYSAVDYIRQHGFTHFMWVGPSGSPEFSYFRKN